MKTTMRSWVHAPARASLKNHFSRKDESVLLVKVLALPPSIKLVG
jgi:hypothetical protein